MSAKNIHFLQLFKNFLERLGHVKLSHCETFLIVSILWPLLDPLFLLRWFCLHLTIHDFASYRQGCRHNFIKFNLGSRSNFIFLMFFESSYKWIYSIVLHISSRPPTKHYIASIGYPIPTPNSIKVSLLFESLAIYISDTYSYIYTMQNSQSVHFFASYRNIRRSHRVSKLPLWRARAFLFLCVYYSP